MTLKQVKMALSLFRVGFALRRYIYGCPMNSLNDPEWKYGETAQSLLWRFRQNKNRFLTVQEAMGIGEGAMPH